MNLRTNFEYFIKNVIKHLRNLEFLSLWGIGYSVSAEVKGILIELPYLTKISIEFELEDLDYLLDKSKKEF